jgi:HEAT repeat protein
LKDKTMTDRDLVDNLKVALMKAATNDDTADAHRLIDNVIAAHGSGALPLFVGATKQSKKCTLALASLLLERGDTECPVSNTAIHAILLDKKHIARDAVLGSMQSNTQSRFAPQLRDIAKDRDDPGWAYAVDALGKWHDAPSIDILLPHCAGVETPFVLLAALVRLRPPKAAVVFEQILAHDEPRERTFALWGLAALGYEEPIAGLINLLDDTDISTATSFTPGQSMRAAQALADIYGLQFEWGDQAAIETVRQHCRSIYRTERLMELTTNLATRWLTRHDMNGEGKA